MKESLKNIEQENNGLAEKLATHLLDISLIWEYAPISMKFHGGFCTRYKGANITVQYGYNYKRGEGTKREFYAFSVGNVSFDLSSKILKPLYNKANLFWNKNREDKVLQNAIILRTELKKLVKKWIKKY